MKKEPGKSIQELIFLIGVLPVPEILSKLQESIEKYQISPTSENLEIVAGFASCLVVKTDFLEKGFDEQTPVQQVQFLLQEGEKYKETEKLLRIIGNTTFKEKES